MKDNKNEDRRRYFRIKDKIHLAVKYISSEDAQQAELDWQNQVVGSSLLSELEKINREIQLLLTQIRHKYPTINKVLELQNQKFDLVSRTLALQEVGVSSELSVVNISAVGISFEQANKYNLGDLLELKVVLYPSLISFTVISQVQKCETTESGYTIAVDYLHIHEHHQEALIKHVVNKQYTQLQTQRKVLEQSP